jgi:phosphatidylserine synthase
MWRNALMLERIQSSRARYVVPNSITFLSLAFGVAAILAAATGALTTAGALILISYVLDLFDGEMARRLEAGSSFGLQLDSLVDMVSLGTAPAVLAFFHLHESPAMVPCSPPCSGCWLFSTSWPAPFAWRALTCCR